MIVDCISDLHGHAPILEGGDLLIVAGDLTGRDEEIEYTKFREWVQKQNYAKKIIIAGNHDGRLYKSYQYCKNEECFKLPVMTRNPFMLDGCEYLCDSETVYEGLRIWGSPWTPMFCNWHFMKKRGDEIKAMWDLIPEDTDILITHGPPFGCLDENYDEEHCGCEMLKLAVERVKPKLHVFGHIHEQGGKTLLYKHEGPNTICVNASIMNENYKPVNMPVRVIL